MKGRTVGSDEGVFGLLPGALLSLCKDGSPR